MCLYVFARKIHQRTQLDFSSQSCHYESGGNFSAENVDLLCWGYDPPGKPEIPIFQENGLFGKSEFLLFLAGRIPNTTSLRSPHQNFLQIHSGNFVMKS